LDFRKEKIMQANLYLRLYHGRKDPQENLEDWGSDGPVFGPYESIQITYGAHIKMHAPDHFDDLDWQDDLVFYDGIYYGDVEIVAAAPASEITLYKHEKTTPKVKEIRK
jgi:hypothetical protein